METLRARFLAPLVRTRGFEMTPHISKLILDDGRLWAIEPTDARFS